jgi:hypothetical protein
MRIKRAHMRVALGLMRLGRVLLLIILHLVRFELLWMLIKRGFLLVIRRYLLFKREAMRLGRCLLLLGVDPMHLRGVALPTMMARRTDSDWMDQV